MWENICKLALYEIVAYMIMCHADVAAKPKTALGWLSDGYDNPSSMEIYQNSCEK